MQRSDIGGGFCVPDKCVTCSLTGKRVLQTEAEQCCLTGAVAAREVLAKSEMTGRFVVPERATACELTGVRVADDELVQSGVSGKWFRGDQAVQLADGSTAAHSSEATQCEISGEWLLESQVAVCPETGVRANKDRFVECEATGTKVLPAGVGDCCVTGKRVRRSLLDASVASGRVAQADKMVRCEATGVMLLPTETARSGVSGKRVDLRLLRRCAVTGTIGLKTELVKSAVSGVWMLPEHTVKLAGGQPAGHHETLLCEWTGQYLPIPATAKCVLSGLQLDKRLLNASGEFAILREILDGTRNGQPFPDAGFLARAYPEPFRGIHAFDYVTSKSKKAHILFGAKSFMGFNKRVFAAVAAGEPSGMRLIGRILFGKRVHGVWVATEVKDVEGAVQGPSRRDAH
jgi:hypothetical protein